MIVQKGPHHWRMVRYVGWQSMSLNLDNLMLHVGIVENLGWFTPLGSTLVGFMFLALDKIGRDLENPSDNIYDVPMTAITTKIEPDLLQLLGETELPAQLAPIHGVLWLLTMNRSCSVTSAYRGKVHFAEET